MSSDFEQAKSRVCQSEGAYVTMRPLVSSWEQRKLGELVGSTYGGGTPKTDIAEYWNGDIPWIQSSNVKEDQLFDIDIPKAITRKGLANSAAQIVPADSIAVVTHVGVGKLIYLPFRYTTSQDFVSLSNLKADASFLSYSLYKRLQGELHMVQGSAIKGITKDNLLEKEVAVPSLEEQEGIGAVLRGFDNLITLHQREPPHTMKEGKNANRHQWRITFLRLLLAMD